MSVQSENSDSIRRYLLGELSEQEREQLERRLMAEDDLYQQLLVAEDDLVDEYVTSTLPEQDRAKFGRHFLQVPELRQDVRFAVALRKHALKTAPQATTEGTSETPRPSLLEELRKFFMKPALGVALAAALLAVALLAIWLTAQNSRLRQQVAQLQARQANSPAAPPDLQEQLALERLRNEQLSAELQRLQEENAGGGRHVEEPQGKLPLPTPTPRAEQSAVFAFTLTPGLIRESGEWKKFSLQPGVREVRIRLDLPEGGYRSYWVAVKTVDGREVLEKQGLRDVGGKFVQINIPARLLSVDDYEVLLSGTPPSGEAEEIGRYYFRVLR